MNRFTRHAWTSMLGTIVLVATTAAQTPSQPPPKQPSSPSNPTSQAPTTRSTDQAGSTVTVEGCVMREADVPGRKPNVAERAGVSEDYILTNTKMVKGSAAGGTGSATGTASGTTPGTSGTTPGTSGTTPGTSGTTPGATGQRPGAAGASASGMHEMMYEIEGLSEEQLKPHVGHRVQIDGTLANMSAGGARTGAGSDDLPELRGTSIRMVSASCPGK